MALTLRYKVETSIPVEVEGLTPTVVRGLSLQEIAKLPIYHGNRQEPLGEFFDLAGDPSDAQLTFEGSLAGVHWIGAGMSEGSIRIEGSAGRHVGSQMTGGAIEVSGDAGDWLGAEMHGGMIRVRGRAGHLVGGAYRGSRRGMTRGTILVHGDAGDEIGHTMRRGTIVIGGNAGDCLGFNLIAGSIYVLGTCGTRPGAGMRRGTIGLLGMQDSDGPTALLPSFRRAGELRPHFLRLTLLELRRQGIPLPDSLVDTSVALYHGDLLELGRGEILLPVPGA